MKGAPHIPDIAAHGVREAHGLLAGHPGLAQPLTCRWPENSAPVGIVLFCHGLGSSGSEYAALSRHWASHGYLVIHPTFRDAIGNVAREEPELGLDPATDLSGWTALPHVRQRMHDILRTPARWLERLSVVEAAMGALDDIAAATCGQPAATLPVAIAGHSFGAYVAQLLAGAEIDLPGSPPRRFVDPRFCAALLLSAQGRDQQGLRAGSWDGMAGPVMTVTGTLDRGANGGDWRWKCEPFDLAPAGDKYLAVFEDGDHHLGGFSDNGRHRIVPGQQAALRQITLAFLDAHLRNDASAWHWLASVGDRIGDCRLLFKRK